MTSLGFFVLFSYFTQSRVFHPQLILWQLIQPDLESRIIVRSQLGPSIQSGQSPCARLQVLTQSTHLSKDCCSQLILSPNLSEIAPPEQLDYRCMSLQPYGREYFSVKTANALISLTVNHKIKIFAIASCIPNFEPSRKPQTLYMASQVASSFQIKTIIRQKLNLFSVLTVQCKFC